MSGHYKARGFDTSLYPRFSDLLVTRHYLDQARSSLPGGRANNTRRRRKSKTRRGVDPGSVRGPIIDCWLTVVIGEFFVFRFLGYARMLPYRKSELSCFFGDLSTSRMKLES